MYELFDTSSSCQFIIDVCDQRFCRGLLQIGETGVEGPNWLEVCLTLRNESTQGIRLLLERNVSRVPKYTVGSATTGNKDTGRTRTSRLFFFLQLRRKILDVNRRDVNPALNEDKSILFVLTNTRLHHVRDKRKS